MDQRQNDSAARAKYVSRGLRVSASGGLQAPRTDAGSSVLSASRRGGRIWSQSSLRAPSVTETDYSINDDGSTHEDFKAALAVEGDVHEWLGGVNDANAYLEPQVLQAMSVKDIQTAIRRLQDELPIREVDEKSRHCVQIFEDVSNTLNNTHIVRPELHIILPDWRGYLGKFKVWTMEWSTLNYVNLEDWIPTGEGERSQIASLAADLDDLLADLTKIQKAVYHIVEAKEEISADNPQLMIDLQDIDDIINGLFRRTKLHEEYLNLKQQEPDRINDLSQQASQVQREEPTAFRRQTSPSLSHPRPSLISIEGPIAREMSSVTHTPDLSRPDGQSFLGLQAQSHLQNIYSQPYRQADPPVVPRLELQEAVHSSSPSWQLQSDAHRSEERVSESQPSIPYTTYNTLDSSFTRRKNPRRFFVVGRVFRTLWSEPVGGIGDAISTATFSAGMTMGSFGERIFSKIRCFVVVKEGEHSCIALCLPSYNGQGVSKPGVKKSDHAIVYTGRIEPPPLPSELPSRGEEGMLQSIRVDPDTPNVSFDQLHRICFTKPYTIEHNLKVQSIGKANWSSMEILQSQFYKAMLGNAQ